MANEFQPYVGPRPFEREDRQRFYGRERESNELLSRVIAHPALLLYAQSGAGKTSLLNASLIPLLEKEGFEVLPAARVRGLAPANISPEEISNLYSFNVLLSWAEGTIEPKTLAKMRLVDFLKTSPRISSKEGPAPRIAVFDQFEELFTFHPERWSDREDFFDQVSEALEADRMMRAIFVMREDYIAELDPYVFALPEKLRTRFRLERLREESALEAVQAPLEGSGYSFAEADGHPLGVAQQLVNNLLKVPVETSTGVATVVGEFVEPVQLQVVCQNLWQKLDHSAPREITHEQLEAFGDVDQALSDFYEGAIAIVVNEVGGNEGPLRRWFDHTLITPAGTRGTVYRGRDETGGIPNSIVDKLVDQHLIRGELRGGARWYELTHDRLIKPIVASNAAWMLQRSGAEQTRQMLEARAAEWLRSGRPKNGLLDEAELLEATRWLESPNAADVGYSEGLFALVQASRAQVEEVARERDRALFVEQQRRLEAEHAQLEEQQRRMEEQARAARRMRLLAAALAVMFLMSMVAAGFAVNQTRVATKQTRLAQARAEDASKARDDAEKARVRAETESMAAREARSHAEKSAKEAEDAKALEAEARKKAEANAKAATDLAELRAAEKTRIARENAENLNRAAEAENSALRYEQNGSLDVAIDYYEDAAAMYRDLDKSEKLAEILIEKLAKLYRERKSYDKAERAYLEGVKIKRGDSHASSFDLNQDGLFYDSIGNEVRAEELYRSAVETKKRESDTEDSNLATMYANLAVATLDNKLKKKNPQYDEPVGYCREAMRIHDKVQGDRPNVNLLRNCASVYERAGLYMEAEPLYKKRLSSNPRITESGEPDAELADQYWALASLQINLGKYSDAYLQLVEAAKIQEILLYRWPAPTSFKPADLYLTYSEQGLVRYYQGHYAEAEALYNRSIDIIRKSQTRKSEEATLLSSLALTYLKEARYSEAEDKETESLNVRGPEGDLSRVAISHSILARVYSAQAKYSDAESMFKRVIAESEEGLGKTHPDIAIDRHYLAEFYVSQRRYKEAREIEEEAIRTLEKSLGRQNWRTSAALSTMAAIRFAEGNSAEAESLYKEAITNLETAFPG